MLIPAQETESALNTIVQAAVVIAAMIISNVGYLATASRMVWAFAREDALPGSRFLKRVNTILKTPLVHFLTLSRFNLGRCYLYIPSACRPP